MTPKEKLPINVAEDIARYRSYHWKLALVSDIVYRRHGLRLPQRCLKALESGAPCPKRCDACESAAPPVPPIVVKEPQRPLPAKSLSDHLYDEWLDIQQRRPSAKNRYNKF